MATIDRSSNNEMRQSYDPNLSGARQEPDTRDSNRAGMPVRKESMSMARELPDTLFGEPWDDVCCALV